MTFSVYHVIVEEFWDIFLTVLFQLIEVCRHLFIHSSVKHLQQHFNQIEVLTSTGPL